jgi:hypothetical protein
MPMPTFSPSPCVDIQRAVEGHYRDRTALPVEMRQSYPPNKQTLIRKFKKEYAKYLLVHGRKRCTPGRYHTLLSTAVGAITNKAIATTKSVDIATRFYRLADEWEHTVGSSSSLTAMTKHPIYREIVKMGWQVVPYMLRDLEKPHGFWFPALDEITGIRPYDRSDAGNYKKMTKAWVQWGKRKQFI